MLIVKLFLKDIFQRYLLNKVDTIQLSNYYRVTINSCIIHTFLVEGYPVLKDDTKTTIKTALFYDSSKNGEEIQLKAFMQ
jgi:hypothetical protein